MMFGLVLVAAVVGVCLAVGDTTHTHKVKKCYECEYSPPREVTKTEYRNETFEIKVPMTTGHCSYYFEAEGTAEDVGNSSTTDCADFNPKCNITTTFKTVPQVRQVQVTLKESLPSGGFGACKGPFTQYTAKTMGVEAAVCQSNCFVRKGKHGRITRGCYRDELHVNPALIGCHVQQGQTYCFCDHDRCNSF